MLLGGIRNDLARPTVHARNLFHTSVAMWDAWAAYDETARPYLLGRTLGGIACSAEVAPVSDRQAAREEAISYAVYRVLRHRFRNSPGALLTLPEFDSLMVRLGHDPEVGRPGGETPEVGSPAALGLTVANCVIEYGRGDGAREAQGYAAQGYHAVNPPLLPSEPGNPDIEDMNRWQPLQFDVFIDQSGNEIPGGAPPFVGPEWGAVKGFALDPGAATARERDGQEFVLYADPGAPPQWQEDGGGETDRYLWNFSRVAVWSGQLDPADGVLWDISPGALGNLGRLPETEDEVRVFYRRTAEGGNGAGWDVNPVTGRPYAPNVVPRGDYTRVLAEFWADGPDSETPPGHWFTILNTVSDSPLLERRWRGEGPVLDRLEWDVKTYFALGGAVHDAAVTAWGLKGWYDYIRPISAIRALAALGQSSNPDAPDYHPGGIPLIAGHIQRILVGDPLAGPNGEHVGEIKLWAWRGPDRIDDPETDEAGVGWVRAAEWWPYQRPTFVTPPFAGYVSGHSTFSRAAAEVLTLATGSPFFPGGLGEFEAPRNEFLVFEEGPSVDVTLQWATYRDAADQCSLSRIWGGIHPPADDLPGRRMGAVIGVDAAELAEQFFLGTAPVAAESEPVADAPLDVFPSPAVAGQPLTVRLGGATGSVAVDVFDVRGRRVATAEGVTGRDLSIPTTGLAPGAYLVRARTERAVATRPIVLAR
ncbi:DUF6851 domain-containing protein [Rubrivirga marina]|uniref:DUF6851 domain-containing protein n=1 Tax=Rubrivirga marina TaxID=1196024 RepID=UPI00117ACD0B|nr:hypothetical protein [Rubrivirga marina]